MSEPEPKFSLTYEAMLPCGHVVRNAVFEFVRPEDIESIAKSIEFSANTLAVRARSYLQRHECELMSAENPAGIRPLAS